MINERQIAVLVAALAYEARGYAPYRSPTADRGLCAALAELSDDEVYALRDAGHTIERAAKSEAAQRAQARYHAKGGDTS